MTAIGANISIREDVYDRVFLLGQGREDCVFLTLCFSPSFDYEWTGDGMCDLDKMLGGNLELKPPYSSTDVDMRMLGG